MEIIRIFPYRTREICNISLTYGSLVWSLGLLINMPISFLGITSLATFNIIDMVDIKNLEYIALLDL